MFEVDDLGVGGECEEKEESGAEKFGHGTAKCV
jgi:hypothetical protein